MAKKKASRGEFNMSAEIRSLLQGNANLSSREVYEQLQQKFPNNKVNRNSCNVAFSQARRKLGIRPGARRQVRRRRPGMRAMKQGNAVNLTLLKAARKFMGEAGSSQAAISAIQQLESLQIG